MKMKMAMLIVLSIICMQFLPAVLGSPCLQAQETAAPASILQRFQAGLAQVSAWRQKAAGLHPAFAKTYPIALAIDGQWQVFEPDAASGGWKLAAQAPTQFPVPVGIRAAMPLDFWGNRMACVVSPEAFATPEGYAFILHEFVHCYQWENGETMLKQGLAVYREAMEGKNYMWELEHPFPYGNAEVMRVYDVWLAELEKGAKVKVDSWRSLLKKGLNSRDWEYMTWQEWKEGMARFLENRVRARFGLKPNLPGAEAPFNRVRFYRGGELLISRLAEGEPGLDKNIELLYRRIFASGG